MYGILLRPGDSPIVAVSGALTSRDMGKIVSGNSSRTYAFPGTIAFVDKSAFYYSETVSVRLNEGLKTLENNCFMSSGMRKLVLPASVESIGESAFEKCKRLEYVDFRNARGLKSIGEKAFHFCRALKQVSLNDGLETIGEECFAECGLEQV